MIEENSSLKLRLYYPPLTGKKTESQEYNNPQQAGADPFPGLDEMLSVDIVFFHPHCRDLKYYSKSL